MRNAAAERAEYERKRAMKHYVADILCEVRAISAMNARVVVSRAFYPLVLQAGMNAGDVLHPAQKQQKGFSGDAQPMARPGFYQFTGHVRFVSDSESWEVASEWLRCLVDGFRHDDITVLRSEQYKGMGDG